MNTQLILSENEMLSKAQGVFDLLDVNETTKSDYKKSIKVFVEFMQGKNLNSQTFLQFKNSLREKGDLAVSTKNTYLVSARILLKELHKQGNIPTDITHNIKGFKQGKKHKKDGLNQGEIEHLCQAISKMDNSFESLRIKALFSLLLFQGLRQFEITGLDVENVDLKCATAMILGKGRDEREKIYLHPEAVKSLGAYMDVIPNIGPLFSCISNRSKGSRLTTKSIRRCVKEAMTNLNINKSTHSFRHYFTTALLKSYNGDVLKVMALTRHKSVDMIQVYNDERITINTLPQYYSAFENVRINY